MPPLDAYSSGARRRRGDEGARSSSEAYAVEFVPEASEEEGQLGSVPH